MKWDRLRLWASVWLIGAVAVVACSPGPRTISGNGLYPSVLLALPVAVVGAVGTYVAVEGSRMVFLQHELGFYFRSWSLAGFWLSMAVSMGAWRTLREARSPGQKEHM